MNNVASVKDRLKNKSRETGKTMQELLTIYGLERTIYRISISPYAENFTLKGGIFLYAVFDRNYARATTDIDLLAERISNDVEDMKKVFTEVFTIDAGDPLRFDLDTLNAVSITEFKEYHGVNVSIRAYLDRTRVDVSLDIGFGDVIYPNRVKMEFPTVLSDERPNVYAYTIASVVAEKFEAIVSLAYDNSRLKDYYDIYVIAHEYDFEGVVLTEAVRETFDHRGTSLNEIVAFEEGFSDDPLRISRWNSFVKRKKATLKISLEESIATIREILQPVADTLINGEDFEMKWDHQSQRWK